MSQATHTPGPWCWRKFGGSLALSTDGRGCIIVMDFVRQGMRAAQPRFGSHRTEQDKGGLMKPADELDIESHPDARLIAAAPDLLASLRILTALLSVPTLESFEWLSDEFTKETGYLRPGKDCHQHSREVREAKWNDWVDAKVAQARSAIAKAEAQ